MHCSMPRRAHTAPGEIIYHALDRANGARAQLGEQSTNRSGKSWWRDTQGEGYGCDHKSQLS
jgi:hypothetical protein